MLFRSTELRINAAKELLADPFRSSAEVASMVGYEDASYFARAFKKRTGMTPTQYRRQAGQKAKADPPQLDEIACTGSFHRTHDASSTFHDGHVTLSLQTPGELLGTLATKHKMLSLIHIYANWLRNVATSAH